MTRFVMRVVACLVALALPLQTLALTMDRIWGPAHLHLTTAANLDNLSALEVDSHGHHDSKHLDEHHRSAIGHHHHAVHDADVVYIGDSGGDHDPLQSDSLKRVHGGLELIATSIGVVTAKAIGTAASVATPQQFCSHICDPLERPPR